MTVYPSRLIALTPGYVLIALCLSGIEVADTFGLRRYRCRDPQFPKEALH